MCECVSQVTKTGSVGLSASGFQPLPVALDRDWWLVISGSDSEIKMRLEVRAPGISVTSTPISMFGLFNEAHISGFQPCV